MLPQLEVPNNAIQPFRPRTFTIHDIMKVVKDAGGYWWLMFCLGKAQESLAKGTPPDPDVVQALVGFVGSGVDGLPVSTSLKNQAQRVDDLFAQGLTHADMPLIADRVDELLLNLATEMSEDLYLHVGSRLKEGFLDPWAWFGKDTLSVFPEAMHDARDCVRCLALDQWTAGVYHGMIVFQYGLHWLANELQLDFPNAIEVANWGTIIERADKAIKDIGQQPKSPARDERVAFLSSLGTHSFYVKEAWRNYVAHGRTRYDEEAAHEIVTNVRGFMAKIARSVLPL